MRIASKLIINFQFQILKRYIYINRRIIEQSINSIANQEPCLLPDIPFNSSTMMRFMEETTYPVCGQDLEDWMLCEVLTLKIDRFSFKFFNNFY